MQLSQSKVGNREFESEYHQRPHFLGNQLFQMKSAQKVSEKVFQTSKKARKRLMAALEPRGKSERKKKTPLRLLD